MFVQQLNAEWGTFYAVYDPHRGQAQEWESVADLVKVLQKKMPSMRKISGWDCNLRVYESMPWADAPEDEAECAEFDGLRIEAEKTIDEGDWVVVDGRLIDLGHHSEARTECDEVHVDDTSVHWSFYPKHSDTMLSTSSINIKDIIDAAEARR